MFNFTYLKTKLCKWGLLIHVYALMQKSLMEMMSNYENKYMLNRLWKPFLVCGMPPGTTQNSQAYFRH